MSEEQIIGLVITIISVVALLGIVLGLVLSKRKGDWPKFDSKSTGTGPGPTQPTYVVEVMWETDELDLATSEISPSLMVDAVTAVIEAWKIKGLQNYRKVDKALTWTAIYIATNETYLSYCGRGAACLIYRKKKILGKRYPVAVISEATMKMLSRRDRGIDRFGEPMIHEMCHAAAKAAFKDFSADHQDDRIWEATGGKDSVQGIASRIFRGLYVAP